MNKTEFDWVMKAILATAAMVTVALGVAVLVLLVQVSL